MCVVLFSPLMGLRSNSVSSLIIKCILKTRKKQTHRKILILPGLEPPQGPGKAGIGLPAWAVRAAKLMIAFDVLIHLIQSIKVRN